jgi:hypothetical protein
VEPLGQHGVPVNDGGHGAGEVGQRKDQENGRHHFRQVHFLKSTTARLS